MAAQAQHSNLVRLAPLNLGDLPAHPDLPASTNRSPLASFLSAFLDHGATFLSPESVRKNFNHTSTKSSEPSAATVEILSHDISASVIANIAWDGAGGKVARSRPPTLSAEHWFMRRSIHKDISSRSAEQAGHARWEEFVYGLRDKHSEREALFTPPLFDARHVLDWNEEVRGLVERRDLRPGPSLRSAGLEEAGGEQAGRPYTNVTLAIYEMCHAIPTPLAPRCFPVLVAAADVNEDEFIAVTVPVSLTQSATGAFYSTGRNKKEGQAAQQRKGVVMGVYAAVETVRRDKSRGEIEWCMATASDAKGNLPMWAQKMGLPGAVAKDVGLFIKWIKTVNEGEIDAVTSVGS